MEAIRNGALGDNDLTNYVYMITITNTSAGSTIGASYAPIFPVAQLLSGF